MDRVSVLIWLLVFSASSPSSLSRTVQVIDILPARPDAVNWKSENPYYTNSCWKRFFQYLHNETRIAMARAETARAIVETPASSRGPFPDFNVSEGGCEFKCAFQEYLAYPLHEAWTEVGMLQLEIVAVDSCASRCTIQLRHRHFEVCDPGEWGKLQYYFAQPDHSPAHDSFKLLAVLRLQGMEIVADGVYYPATGKMHLVGCTHDLPAVSRLNQTFWPNETTLREDSESQFPQTLDQLSTEAVPLTVEAAKLYSTEEVVHAPPLNSTRKADCSISATIHYPPLHSRWNSQRTLKFELRSTRHKSDPLYFAPVDRTVFFPYRSRDNSWRAVKSQRSIETASQVVLLLLGLLCIALQIDHGQRNEEALPFVSLAMVGIQLANHLSQTSLFMDLQIAGYKASTEPNSSELYYYSTMAWSRHVPYQAMTMTALFMYAWIFHKVGDRRRIMQLRVARKRPAASVPPSEWLVMYATIALFWFAAFIAFFVIDGGAMFIDLSEYDYFTNDASSPFVSSKFYWLSQVQWGMMNRLTGLVVSFFLLPQWLGNLGWNVQGRPLSGWFYGGITFLQSLPHAFSVAKHFQVLPIFPVYDPYLDTTFGIFNEDSMPWWQMGVVLCSAALALSVHLQFSNASANSSTPKINPDEHQRLREQSSNNLL